VKGDRKTQDQKLSWSFRVGTKLHGNPNITDIYYLSFRRSRLDYQPKRDSIFNNSGTYASSAFIVNATVTAGNQFEPSVANLADGRFVITWTDPGADPAQEDTDGSSVRAQIFDPRTAAVNIYGTSFGDD
jgi:hypothetical protein